MLLRHRAAIGLSLLLVGASGSAPTRPEELVRPAGSLGRADVRAHFGPSFRVLNTEHYRVVSDTSERFHVVVSGVLELFYREVHPRFFVREPERLPFYLFHEGQAFEAFLGRRGIAPTSRMGLYDGGSRMLVARRTLESGGESGVGTLFHEVVHSWIDADFDERAPAWLNEGFASLFEAGRIVEGRWAYGNPNPPREAILLDAFEAGKLPGLAAYLSAPDARFRDETTRDLYYATGRSLFLSLLRSDGEPALAAFIAALREGGEPVAALEKASGRPLAEIETRWHETIRTLGNAGAAIWRAHRASDPLAILAPAARAHPDFGNLQVEAAVAYLAKGDREAARRYAEAALRDPRCMAPYVAHATIARTLLPEQPREAAIALSKALNMQPWVEAVMVGEHELLAALFEAAKRPDRAAAVRAELERLRRADTRTP